MTREKLEKTILDLIPTDRFVDADDVVHTLSYVSAKAVWGRIVVMAMDGRITCDNIGQYDGHAMIRRVA